MVRTDFVDSLGPRYYQLQIKCTIEPGFSRFSVLLFLSNHFFSNRWSDYQQDFV